MFKSVSHLAGVEADWSRHAIKENVISPVSPCMHVMCTCNMHVMCTCNMHVMCTCNMHVICTCMYVGATEELGHCVH